METSHDAPTRRRATAVIAALGAFYLVVIAFVLDPRTFFAGDPGVKYLQAWGLAQSHWQRLSVANPAPGIDPDARFSALSVNQFERLTPRDPYYGVYSVLFTVPVSFCLWAFGLRGLYVVPILATLGTLVLTYRLSARSAPRLAWLSPVLVGAASPFMFYSVDLWEHTLAALCLTACVLVFLGTADAATTRRGFLAGVLFGLAIDLREELYGLLLLAPLAAFWIERGRRLAAIAAAAGGVLVAAIPQWLLRSALIGVPMRRSLLRAATSGGAAAVVGAPVPWTVQVALITPVSWVGVLAIAAVLRWAATRARAAWRLVALGTLAAVVVGLAVADAFDLLKTWGRPDGLVAAFPSVLLLALWPPRGAASDPAGREVSLLLALSFGFAVLVAIVEPWGSAIVPIGGSQFGPRFLLPIIPLLAVAITYVVDRAETWRASGVPRAAGAIVAAVVTAAGIAVQLQGVRDLRATKAGYARLLQASEAIGRDEPIVTDVWWYPAVTATALFEHQTVAVNRPETGTASELLTSPAMTNVAALTFVTEADGPSGDAARALADAGWREVRRQRVALWRDLDFVAFARDPSRQGAVRDVP